MPYIRAKILFTSVAILNERIRLDSARIEGLWQSKAELQQALALCENTVSNNEKAAQGYKAIIANNKKKARNRLFYFTGAGVVVGLVVGVLVR